MCQIADHTGHRDGRGEQDSSPEAGPRHRISSCPHRHRLRLLQHCQVEMDSYVVTRFVLFQEHKKKL